MYTLFLTITLMTEPESSGGVLGSSTGWMPLLFDTTVMFLTMYRTASSVYSRNASDMLQVLFREGLLYYRCVDARIYYIIIANTTQLHLHDHPDIDHNGKHHWCWNPQYFFPVRMLPS